MTKIIELIITYDRRGKGIPSDPIRMVVQLFTKDGCLVAEETTKWDKGFFKAEKIKNDSV